VDEVPSVALARLMDLHARRVADGEPPTAVSRSHLAYFDIDGEVTAVAESAWFLIEDAADTDKTEWADRIGREFVRAWSALGESRTDPNVQTRFFSEWSARIEADIPT
jgi:hypothetical protein